MVLSTKLRLLSPVLKQARPPLRISSPAHRSSSTISPPAPPTSDASGSTSSSTPPPSPKEPLRPTEFTEKAAPRDVYERPEEQRGMDSQTKIPPTTPPMSSAITIPEEYRQFIGPARHRLLNDRTTARPLPPHPNNWIKFSIYGGLALASWALFIFWATNLERLSSSVMQSVTFFLRNSTEVMDLFGENIKLEPPPWKYGDPYISGSVNNMQGRVDLKFRIYGNKEHGTVYFTSIRPSQFEPWRILRFKAVLDSGEVIRLQDKVDKI